MLERLRISNYHWTQFEHSSNVHLNYVQIALDICGHNTYKGVNW